MSTVNLHTVVFNTRKFETAHGKSPRGYGSWAFCPAQFYGRSDESAHIQWFTGNYSDAKKSARAFFSVQPNVYEVVVCS